MRECPDCGNKRMQKEGYCRKWVSSKRWRWQEMKKGDIVSIEDCLGKNGEEVKLLRSIGRKDKSGQFWEIQFKNGDKDVRLLR